jgi:hypothetical protein
MNFELTDQLSELLKEKKLDEAIALAEFNLKKIPTTDFHKIIGRNIKHLATDLAVFVDDFDQSTRNVLKKKQGFIKGLFSNKNSNIPAAYYCEMNGFTINYDRWFIDLFSFEEFSTVDWDWLSDFYDSTSESLTITGLEDIQTCFQDTHEKKRFEEPNLYPSYEICELLVILRLQELFRETYQRSESQWTRIPMFVTAHDYEMIYKVT